MDLENCVMMHKSFPYKLIRSGANPMQSWFYSPFKGERNEMPRYKMHWNFIQSNTRILMEKAFGMLEEKFKILLKKVNIPLHHM
jgi:hypothetical protein